MADKIRRLRTIALVILVVMGWGTLGFILIEGWGLLDSVYMTAITITTVGYGEVHPLSQMGQVFATTLAILGVGTTLYCFGVVFEQLVEGQLRDHFGERKMGKGIRKMKDHFVICGFGRVGRHVVNELRRRGHEVVIIEKLTDAHERLKGEGISYVFGDATDDVVLSKAGVESAKGLVVALPHEADNVYVALSCKQLNPRLRIVARADEERSRQKLLLAGADEVVCPHEIGGLRLAECVTGAHTVDGITIEPNGRIDRTAEEMEQPVGVG